jgi:ankyrin repeat protein
MMKTLAVAFLAGNLAFAAAPSPDRVRATAEKAVAALQNSQKTWFAKESCFSCHQQVLPALAFSAARSHGIRVDEAAAHQQAVKAFSYFTNLQSAVEYTRIIDPAMSDGYGLIAAACSGLKPGLATAVYARHIALRQESDGHWETYDERPPQSYSPFTATSVALTAVRNYSHHSRQSDVQARTAKARAWFLAHKPGTTEERVYWLIGAREAGVDQAALAKMSSELRYTQRPDGGWDSLDGRPSDAYSTSQALVALHDVGGIATTDGIYQKGIDYLLRTQAADGTWHVVSRLHPPAPVSPPYIETGHPYGHDQFISAMGESWAVMALAQMLPAVKAEPAPLEQAKAPEPWVETLLFGSAADVKKLLDAGFDPNSATAVGGMTALMLAAPDVEKMKLLIARGANADARANDRFSALLVASQYPQSAAAISLLLDHGAKVRLPKGQGAALYNAFPLILAAFAGNDEGVAKLRNAGDRPDDRMNFLGMFPATPMLELATTNRVSTVRTLIDAGAKVDDLDGDAMTPLAWAAIANRIDMAALLIQRKADVNHVDKHGMTPLLYAASIDFGGPAMIELLLRSGANPQSRTKDGLTALDLAKKYNHTHLYAALAAKNRS